MRVISLLLVVVLALGCSSRGVVPKEIIQQDKMADIIVDVSLAESFTEMFIMKDSSLIKDTVLKKEISKVLALHKTSVQHFTTSYSFYSKHPGLFKIMMDTAGARVNRRRDKAYAAPMLAVPKNPD